MNRMMNNPKKVVIMRRNAPLRPRKRCAGWGPKGWGRRRRALGFDIIRELAWHMNRLGHTPETFALKCKWSTDRFLQLTKRPYKLDLRVISLWSSIIGADLLICPNDPDGYFGRKPRVHALIGPGFLPGIKSYLRAAKTVRVLGTPYLKPKHLR